MYDCVHIYVWEMRGDGSKQVGVVVVEFLGYRCKEIVVPM